MNSNNPLPPAQSIKTQDLRLGNTILKSGDIEEQAKPSEEVLSELEEAAKNGVFSTEDEEN